MKQHTRLEAIGPDSGPRLPNGRRAGQYLREGGVLVWERNVHRKHVLNFMDGFSINEGLLKQLRRAGVRLIRYVLDGDVYEIELTEFLASCAVLPRFARGEDVYALPRASWRFQPRLDDFGLFAFAGKA